MKAYNKLYAFEGLTMNFERMSKILTDDRPLYEPPSINNLLNENVDIVKDDEDALYNGILMGKNVVLNSYIDIYDVNDRVVYITKKRKNITEVKFFSEMREMVDIIIEMCDNMSWQFEEDETEENIIFKIKVSI